MKLTKMRLSPIFAILAVLSLVGCESIQQAAQDDCTSIGWTIGSPGYNDCYKARVYERKLDYSLPAGDTPSPSVI